MHRYRVLPVIANLLLITLSLQLLHYFIKGHFFLSLQVLQVAAPTPQPSIHPRAAETKGQDDGPHAPTIEAKNPRPGTLEAALAQVSTLKREVIIVYTSMDLLEYSNNFIHISELYAHGVQKLLFVTEISVKKEKSVCGELNKKGAACWVTSDKTEKPGQSAAVVALRALQLNYTVLLLEYDVVMVSDVLDDLRVKCNINVQCNGAVMTKDRGRTYHGALLYLHSTKVSLVIMKYFSELYDRPRVEHAITTSVSIAEEDFLDINILKLPEKNYFKGYVDYSTVIARAQSSAKAVHINSQWMGIDTTYLMRESALWFVDPDNYYDQSLKYITFSNDWLGPFVDATPPIKERDALVNALVLADILNRVLILPKFHCWWHGYNCIVTMVANPAKLISLGIPFRESSFLGNPRTPKIIKHDPSPNYYIGNTETYPDHLASLDRAKFQPNPEEPVIELKAGNTEFVKEKEVHNWFGHMNYTLLRLYTTHGLDLCQGNKSISKVCGFNMS